MASSRPLIWTALVRPAMHKRRILAARQCRLHLADALGDRREPRLGRAERRRQVGVLEAEAADARRLQLLDRALGVERIAVAMVGVDHQRQVAGAVDAIGLAREFTEGEDDQVGRAQHRERGRRAREHADFEAQILGDAGGDGIEHRAGMHAAVAAEDRAEALAAVGPVHLISPISQRFDGQTGASPPSATAGSRPPGWSTISANPRRGNIWKRSSRLPPTSLAIPPSSPAPKRCGRSSRRPPTRSRKSAACRRPFWTSCTRRGCSAC